MTLRKNYKRGYIGNVSTKGIYDMSSLVFPPVLINFTEQEITSNVTSVTFNVPTGTVNGDLMVALLSAGGGSNDVGNWVNANFTFAVKNTTNPNIAVAYRVASGEGATVTFTTNNDCKMGGVLITYRNAQWGTTGTTAKGIGTAVTANSINVPIYNSILIGAFAQATDSVTWTNNSDMTFLAELDDDEYSHSWYFATSLITSSGATGNKTLTSNTNNEYQAVLCSVSPL